MTIGEGTLAFGPLAIVGNGQGGLVTPPYASSLMGLVGATTPVGYNAFGGTMCVDHVGQKLYFLEASATTGDDGVKKIDAAVPGDELLQHTETDYFSGAHGLNALGCFHPNGRLFASLDFGNSRPFACINAADLSLVNVFGVGSSSLSPSSNSPFRLIGSFQMGAIQAAGRDYLISRGDVIHEIAVVDVTNDAATLTYVEQINLNIAAFAPGYSGPDQTFATFYVLGRLSSYGVGDPTPATLTEYIVGDSVLKRPIRSIAPTDIDATWTNFATISDPGFDNADGGVLAQFTTLDTVMHTAYLAKFSRTDGSLVFALPLPDGAQGLDLPQCSINGTLEFFVRQFSGTSYVLRVNLADGTTTTTAWNRGFSTMEDQVFDYRTGSITANMSYSASTGPVPTYIGDYLPGHSNSIPSDRWGRIYSGAPYPDAGESTAPAGTQRRIAWSYVLDGHTFYVLDLGEEGTWVWDDIGKHWSHFETSSTSPQWNMAGGCMWGDRIVAGDLSSGDVWELDPNAVQDNGALDIQHIVTGIVTRRSRNAMGVGAVRVAASIGQIQDQSGATLRLRFSDDQEATWSAYYDVVLTEGDTSAEIAYRALGSFAAPGRVFELSDTGGLIRIDSCDLDPEKDQDESAA